MGVEENLRLIEARSKAVNAHDWNRFQGFYANSIRWNDPGLPTPLRGPTAVRKRLEILTAAFPDLRWKLQRIFGHGELVSAEFVFTGRHAGPLPDNRISQPIPPTNKRIRIQASGVYQIRKGKIIDSRIYFDFGSLRQKGRA